MKNAHLRQRAFIAASAVEEDGCFSWGVAINIYLKANVLKGDGELERGQRRLFARAKIEWPVSISTNKDSMERATLNVSAAGAFISSRNPLDKYEIFDLIISSPDRHIKTTAEVVWSNSHYASLLDMPHGMGVRFLRIQDSDRDYLKEVVSEYNK